MSNIEYTSLESCSMLKKDLINFLSDTDAWVIAESKKACETQDWDKISNVIDVTGLIHNLSHSH